MTLQQIQELTLEQVTPTLIQRLELEEGVEPTQSQLESEFEAYKAELIAAEEARLAEIARVEDLKSRYAALSDSGLIQMSSGVQNPAAYFRDSILKNKDKEAAEANLAALESAYQSALSSLEDDSWLRNREREYAKLDKMLLEALAEKENGRPEKMQEYLQLRQGIKDQYPKPQ